MSVIDSYVQKLSTLWLKKIYVLNSNDSNEKMDIKKSNVHFEFSAKYRCIDHIFFILHDQSTIRTFSSHVFVKKVMSL